MTTEELSETKPYYWERTSPGQRVADALGLDVVERGDGEAERVSADLSCFVLEGIEGIDGIGD